RILIGSVINDQLGDDAQSPLVCGVEERAKIVERSVVWIDVVIIGDVVAVITQRRWIKGQEPDCGDAKLLEIVEFLDQTAEIANPVAIAVMEGLDVQLV